MRSPVSLGRVIIERLRLTVITGHLNYIDYASYLVPDEKVVNTVREIFKMYAYDETISLGQIRKWLVSNNITTNRGMPWTSTSIGRILRSPVYVRADADIYTYLHDVKKATINNDINEFTGVCGCYAYFPGNGSSLGRSTTFFIIIPCRCMACPKSF